MTTDAIGEWPPEIQCIQVPSSVDGSLQPSLHYSPPSSSDNNTKNEPRPLLIALHTWSFDYLQAGGQVVHAQWCIRKGWHFLHPNFRGPNQQPTACGSDVALQDVLDATEYVCTMTKAASQQQQQQEQFSKPSTYHPVDSNRIYIVGVSGGGHMALLLAGRHAEKWAGVSAWCGIADIATWWRERSLGVPGVEPSSNFQALTRYAHMVQQVLDGKTPDERPEECVARSPVTYLGAAQGVNLDIHAGIHDGREGGSVPFSQSLRAYNAVVPQSEQLGDDFISQFYGTQRVPADDDQRQGDGGNMTKNNQQQKEQSLQTRPIHFRRIHNNTRVTIFEGGHEILHVAALNWLAHQRRGRDAVWDIDIKDVDWFQVKTEQAQSGK